MNLGSHSPFTNQATQSYFQVMRAGWIERASFCFFRVSFQNFEKIAVLKVGMSQKLVGYPTGELCRGKTGPAKECN